MNENPKVDPPPLSNTEKDPDHWVSGDAHDRCSIVIPEDAHRATWPTGRIQPISNQGRSVEADRRAQRDVGTKARGRPLPKHTLTVATSFVLGGVDNL